MAVTKDARVTGHLKKGKTGQYAKKFFTSYELIQWTLLVLLSQGKELTLEMDEACKFPAQFYSREKKNSWTCTLYNCLYAWNIVSKVWRILVLSFKSNNFICFLLFCYLRSLKAKYPSLVIPKIIRALDKDTQLVRTSIL